MSRTTQQNPPPPTQAEADPDTSMHDASSSSSSSSSPAAAPPTQPTKKRKRKDAAAAKNPQITHSTTFRAPAWSYLHLELITPGTATTLTPPTSNTTSSTAAASTSNSISRAHAQSAKEDLDPLSLPLLLQPALGSYLGLLGSSIPIDILKTRGRECWIRVPRGDEGAVRAGLSAWVGVAGGDVVPGYSGPGAQGDEAGIGRGKVRVAWRVRSVCAGGLWGACAGSGADIFEN